MTTYQMTPIKSGTRMRVNHSVFDAVIISDFSPVDWLTGSELWTAPADGAEVKKGDKWLLVTHCNGATLPIPGWTAYIHKGVPICQNFADITTPPPPPAHTFPPSFVLTEPDGSKAEYVFVRVIE